MPGDGPGLVLPTGAFGGAGDRFLAKLLTEGGSGRFSAMLRGGVAEGLLEEAPQEGGQQIAKNRALGVVDDSVGTFDDVPNAKSHQQRTCTERGRAPGRADQCARHDPRGQDEGDESKLVDEP